MPSTKAVFEMLLSPLSLPTEFLLHDNTPSYKAAIIKKFLANRNVAVLHHPPYSPDPACADYFLFPKLKFPLKGQHFQTVEEIKCTVTRELNNI
jgi:hypothetical protein